MPFNERDQRKKDDLATTFAKFQLTDSEHEAIFKLFTRTNSDVDESARYIAYYFQIKLLGTLPFRIIHSKNTWVKIKKLFRQAGLDLTDSSKYPERTPLATYLRAVDLFDKAHPIITNLWATLVDLERRDGNISYKRRVFYPALDGPNEVH